MESPVVCDGNVISLRAVRFCIDGKALLRVAKDTNTGRQWRSFRSHRRKMDGQGRQRSRSVPPGIAPLRSLRGEDFSYSTYRASVLMITFIAYAFFHMSRKPPSIVKSVLDPEGSEISSLGSWHYDLPASLRPSFSMLFYNGTGSMANNVGQGGWAPFDGMDGKNRLGETDVAFLASYAFGMYFAGHLGDRLDLRKFLSAGMLGSGFFVCLFGMGWFWNIHRLEYFLLVQMAAGLFQATGWPSVVTIVGHWFGKKKRGLIMGIWNAHTSVGNILGSLIAASALKLGWGWSFIIPGTILAGGGVLVWSLLVVDPLDVGLLSPNETEAAAVLGQKSFLLYFEVDWVSCFAVICKAEWIGKFCDRILTLCWCSR